MKLLVVESPTKANTINRFLGNKEYKVVATVGHVRDLPKKRFGVKIEENGKVSFSPQYEIMKDKRKVVKELKDLAKKADMIILATDPDREGEAIAWHINYFLKKKDLPVKRIAFHEITKEAIEEALKESRDIDMNRVDSQQARRILDRIVGYKLSPLLWRKVRRGLSAGRVQSVALRLVVEREREIEKFKKEKYFRVTASFDSKKQWIAELVRDSDKAVEAKVKEKLFAGSYTYTKTIYDSLKLAQDVVNNLSGEPIIEKITEREVQKRPYAPFTTSTLQQEASRKFGWSSRMTMRIAQSLYEEGLITYHRTDSTYLNPKAVDKMRGIISKEYGKEYLPVKAIFYKTKSRMAQEAHEAIRPSDPNNQDISKNNRNQKLYDLIWKRAIAAQMNPARIAQTTLEIKDGNYLFRTTGSRVVFDGFSKVYPTKFSEITLPQLKEGQKLEYDTLSITEHETMPPPRYNEASLISTLEKEGIGRPSTYAPIISVIQQRNYIEKEEGKFKPTELGVAVNDFLVKYFSDIIDLPFTAGMEDDLDEIAQGKENWEEVLGKFWKPFIEKVDKTKEEGERVKIEEEKLNEKCPECKEGDLIIRIGRFGKFVACSKFPECKYTRPFSQEAGFDCPDCGKPTVVRRTKKGRTFYGCSGWPKCKWAAWKKPKS